VSVDAMHRSWAGRGEKRMNPVHCQIDEKR